MKYEDIVEVAKCLSDMSRVEILFMLSEGEKCACKLLERFDFTQPTLSYHMRILVNAGLVKTRQEGKWVHYRINLDRMNEFLGSLEPLKVQGECDDVCVDDCEHC